MSDASWSLKEASYAHSETWNRLTRRSGLGLPVEGSLEAAAWAEEATCWPRSTGTGAPARCRIQFAKRRAVRPLPSCSPDLDAAKPEIRQSARSIKQRGCTVV